MSKQLTQAVATETGEKVIAGSVRPDGTVRKERRIRAGYTPQDEQPVYQSRGTVVRRLFVFWSAALWKEGGQKAGNPGNGGVGTPSGKRSYALALPLAGCLAQGVDAREAWLDCIASQNAQ